MFKCFDSIYGHQKVISHVNRRGSVYGGSAFKNSSSSYYGGGKDSVFGGKGSKNGSKL